MLELEEKAVVFCEEHLPHHVIVFDHFEQVYYIKISVEHLNTFLQLRVFFGAYLLKLARFAAEEAFEVEGKRLAGWINELPLV